MAQCCPFREFPGKQRASHFKNKLQKSFLQLWTLLSLLLSYGQSLAKFLENMPSLFKHWYPTPTLYTRWCLPFLSGALTEQLCRAQPLPGALLLVPQNAALALESGAPLPASCPHPQAPLEASACFSVAPAVHTTPERFAGFGSGPAGAQRLSQHLQRCLRSRGGVRRDACGLEAGKLLQPGLNACWCPMCCVSITHR